VPNVAVVWMNDFGQGLMGEMADGQIEMQVYASGRSTEFMHFFPFTPGVTWQPVQLTVDISGGGVVQHEVESRLTPNARTIGFRAYERSLDYENGAAQLTTDMGIALIDEATGSPVQSQDADGRAIIVFGDVPFGTYQARPILNDARYVADARVVFQSSDQSSPIYLISRRESPSPYTGGYTTSYPEIGPYDPISPTVFLGSGDTLDDQIYRFETPFAIGVGPYQSSRLFVHANGYVSIGSPGLFTDIYQPLPSVDPAYAHVAVLGGDLMGSSEARISLQISGQAPNRSIAIEWLNMMPYMESATTGTKLTASIILHETGVIQLRYGPMVTEAPFSFGVGIRGMDLNDVASLRATKADEWVMPARTSDPTTESSIAEGVVPNNGMTIEFRPAASSVDNLHIERIEVAPRPASGNVAVRLPGQAPEVNTVRLVDALGQSTWIPCEALGTTVRFDVSTLAPGLYGVYIGGWASTVLVGR
jgi:hypothetical protein